MRAELVESHSTGKARLLRLLDELEREADGQNGQNWETAYLTPQSLARREADTRPRRAAPDADALSAVLDAIGASDTGVAAFLPRGAAGGRAVAVCPPFPLQTDGRFGGVNAGPLRRLLRGEPVVGVVLLRLGRYAVGVLRGERLIASKTAGRYVKNRHRAGGQSQRRFERSRERLVRELYDKTCEVAREVFAPYSGDIAHILLGGEAATLNGFMRRCPLLSREWGGKILERRLAIDRPDQKTLNGIGFEVWKSRVRGMQARPDAAADGALPSRAAISQPRRP